MKKIKFLALALVATLSFGLTSCDKDKDLDYQSQTFKDGDKIQVHDLNTDSKPFYKLNFYFGIKGGNVYVEGLTSRVEVPQLNVMQDPQTAAAVMDFGKVDGLSLVDALPGDASFMASDKPVTSVGASEEHGYVIKAWGATKFAETYEGLHNDGWNDPTPIYVRLWIKDIDDGEYEIRYEYPWKP